MSKLHLVLAILFLSFSLISPSEMDITNEFTSAVFTNLRIGEGDSLEEALFILDMSRSTSVFFTDPTKPLNHKLGGKTSGKVSFPTEFNGLLINSLEYTLSKDETTLHNDQVQGILGLGLYQNSNPVMDALQNQKSIEKKQLFISVSPSPEIKFEDEMSSGTLELFTNLNLVQPGGIFAQSFPGLLNAFIIPYRKNINEKEMIADIESQMVKQNSAENEQTPDQENQMRNTMEEGTENNAGNNEVTNNENVDKGADTVEPTHSDIVLPTETIAVFDVKSYFITIPQIYYEKFRIFFGDACTPFQDGEYTFFKCNLDEDKIKQYKEIIFVINGYGFKISPEVMFEYVESEKKYVTLIRFSENSSYKNAFVFGLPFFVNYQVKFDYDNRQIGFNGRNPFELTRYFPQNYGTHMHFSIHLNLPMILIIAGGAGLIAIIAIVVAIIRGKKVTNTMIEEDNKV